MLIEVLTLEYKKEIRDISIQSYSTFKTQYNYMDANGDIIRFDKNNNIYEHGTCAFNFNNYGHAIALDVNKKDNSLIIYFLDLIDQGHNVLKILATEAYVLKYDSIDSFFEKYEDKFDKVCEETGRFKGLTNKNIIATCLFYSLNLSEIDLAATLKSIYGDFIHIFLSDIIKIPYTDSVGYDDLLKVVLNMKFSKYKWELPSLKNMYSLWDGTNIARIEAYGNKAVVRMFTRINRNPKEYIEYGRILISKERNILYSKVMGGWMEVDLNGKLKNDPYFDLNFISVYFSDDLENTYFKYYKKYYKELDSKSFFSMLIYKGLQNLCSIDDNYYVITCLMQEIDLHTEGFIVGMKDIFGYFNPNAESFCKMIGAPSYVLDILAKSSSELFELEDVFSTEFFANLRNSIGQNFFLHMDKNTFIRIFQFLKKIFGKIYADDCFYHMILNFGNKNIIRYINKLSDFLEYYKNTHCSNIFVDYYDYLQMCYELSQFNINYPWNIKPEDVRSSHNNVIEVYNFYKESYRISGVIDKFNNIKPSWEQYKYEDENYIIIPPNAPEDLISEGVKLKHCVGSYLEKVCDGGTSIFFIREKDDLDKPFFTLEIRDNKVRQCHGFANCDMTKEVEEFLQKFCKEKNIEYNQSNAILAV